LLPVFVLEELYQKGEKEGHSEWIFWFVTSILPENESDKDTPKKASYTILRLTQAELAKVWGFVEAKRR